MADKTKSDLFRLLYYYRKNKRLPRPSQASQWHSQGQQGCCLEFYCQMEGGLHMPLTAPVQPHSTAQHRYDILAIVVSCKEKTPFFSAPPPHVLKAGFKLLKVDKSKGRTCTVANTFGYYSDLEDVGVGWLSGSCPIPPIPISLCHSEMSRRQSDHGARTTFSFS